MWVDRYLRSHKTLLNFNQSISDYKIDLFSFEESYDDVVAYRVKITLNAKRYPKMLFKTKSKIKDGTYKYDLLLRLRKQTKQLVYVSDESYQAFDTMQTYWQYKDDVSQNVDALEGLYRTNHEYLEVRDVVGGDWI